MRTHSFTNPYADFNSSLFHQIYRYSIWTPEDFSNVIERLRSLPTPDTEAKDRRLRVSRLGETIPNLVRSIGTELASTNSSAAEKRAESEERLTELWYACRPLTGCFEVRGFTAFLRVAIEADAPPSLLKDICSTAQTQGIDSPLNFVAKLLALKSQVLVAERRADELDELFNKADALELHFRSFHWGLLAGAAGKLQDARILEIIWQRSGASHATFEEKAWVQFSNAAGLVHHGETLGQIWDEWIVLGDRSGQAVWSCFANATARRRDAVLLETIWKASEPYRMQFEPQVWGAFAKAAGNVGREELLLEMWTAHHQTNSQLNSNAWGSFASAAGEAGQGDLLEAVWTELQGSATSLEPKGWGSLAKATQGAKRPDLLRDIFYSWQPQPETLSKAEHAIWGSFFGAAFGLGDEALALEMFRRLSAAADPVRLQNWGTLTGPLIRFAAQLKDEAMRSEITETLGGFRLDTARCFTILANSEPSSDLSAVGDKPFEGAGRCLLRWLVNSYFYCPPDEFDERLASVVDSILALKQNQLRAWHALVCRGQESYVACLRAIYFSRYKQYFAYIKDLSDEEFMGQILQGHIEQLLVDFRRDVINQIALPQGTHSVDRGNPALSPIIELLVANQEDRIRTRKVVTEKVAFFKQTLELFENADISSLTRNDWLDFLRLLLQEMSQKVWSAMIDNSRGQLHELHNEFRERFPSLLGREDITDTGRERVIHAARVILLDYARFVGGHRFGELKPINIVPAVSPRLVGIRSRNPMTTADLPRRSFNIAAWNGARDDLLVPLLRELRFNAEKNLRQLETDEQIYRVSLKEGEGKEADYAILTVSNAYRPGGSGRGTGQGTGLIQRFADALGGFALSSQSPGDNGLMMWTWHIYLPLFKETPQ